jgi:hypothetical protein
VAGRTDHLRTWPVPRVSPARWTAASTVPLPLLTSLQVVCGLESYREGVALYRVQPAVERALWNPDAVVSRCTVGCLFLCCWCILLGSHCVEVC